MTFSLARFPADWRCTVTVTRGGRTQAGVVSEPETFTLRSVLVVWASTADSGNWDEAALNLASLWLDRGHKAEGQDTPFYFQDKDLIDVPQGPWPSGRFQIDGQAKPGQLATEVPLRKVS